MDNYTSPFDDYSVEKTQTNDNSDLPRGIDPNNRNHHAVGCLRESLLEFYSQNKSLDFNPERLDAIISSILNNDLLKTWIIDTQAVTDRKLSHSADSGPRNSDRGGFGLAFPVKHYELTHDVRYIKIIPPGSVYDNSFFDSQFNINNENSLQHHNCPYLVQIENSSSCRIDGRREGMILLMEKLTPLPRIDTHAELVKLAVDICKGICYLQERRIIHRDIKPQNIMVDNFGNYKIIDFGALLYADEIGNASHSVCISREYCPLEANVMYDSDEDAWLCKYNSTTDTYMLGVTLMVLLATDENRSEVIDLIDTMRKRGNFVCSNFRKVLGNRYDLLYPTDNCGVNLVNILNHTCSNVIKDRPENAEKLLKWLTQEENPTVYFESDYEYFSNEHTEYIQNAQLPRLPIKVEYSNGSWRLLLTPGSYLNRKMICYSIGYSKCDTQPLLDNILANGFLVVERIDSECTTDTEAYTLEDHLGARYLLRCINCDDTNNSNRLRNETLAIYHTAMADTSECEFLDDVLDLVFIKHKAAQPPHDEHHFVLVLSKMYDQNSYITFEDLLADKRDDYSSFTIADRCEICFKAIYAIDFLNERGFFHGNLNGKRILCSTSSKGTNPSIRIRGFGRPGDSRYADQSRMARLLIRMLTGDEAVPLQKLPCSEHLRLYFKDIESQCSTENFTISSASANHTNAFGQPPIMYDRFSKKLTFDREYWPAVNITLILTINGMKSPLITNADAKLPVPKDWTADIRVYVKWEDGKNRLYAFCQNAVLKRSSNQKYIHILPDNNGLHKNIGIPLVEGDVIVDRRSSAFARLFSSESQIVVDTIKIK